MIKLPFTIHRIQTKIRFDQKPYSYKALHKLFSQMHLKGNIVTLATHLVIS